MDINGSLWMFMEVLEVMEVPFLGIHANPWGPHVVRRLRLGGNQS
jgi:hypothetical protein